MATGGISNDQNKRAMDALERRFASAKADILNRERRNNRNHLQPAKPSNAGPISARKSAQPRRVSEADEPIYRPISLSVDANLIAGSEVSEKGKPQVDRVLHQLLQSGDSALKYNRGSKSFKMDRDYLLLDNAAPARSKSVSGLSVLRTQSKRSRKHMSMRQLKKLGSLELPDEFCKFDLFMPMHDMWKDYLIQILKSVGKNHVAQHIMNADLHGAILRVVDCKVGALIGVVGIMVRETADTFGIVTQEDKFVVVLKKGSVFLLQADCWKVTLLGDKFVSSLPNKRLRKN